MPPTVINPTVTANWLTGFVDGDGSFFIKIYKSSSHKCDYNVRAAFDITQVPSEKVLLSTIGNSFFGGIYNLSCNSLATHMVFTNYLVHREFVEPFFIINRLLSRKYFDFIIWQKVLNLIGNKKHLNSADVDSIRELRELQHLHRKLIHPSILNEVESLRPDWCFKLDLLT